MSEFERRVRAALDRLEPGDLATYGEIAEEAGFPGAARAVGRILATSDGLPWWRVVTSGGRLVPGHEREHAQRLRAEGVSVPGRRATHASRPKRTPRAAASRKAQER
jgi:methylated-DNA-protein-cysteine methyltransferase-like protein